MQSWSDGCVAGTTMVVILVQSHLAFATVSSSGFYFGYLKEGYGRLRLDTRVSQERGETQLTVVPALLRCACQQAIGLFQAAIAL